MKKSGSGKRSKVEIKRKPKPAKILQAVVEDEEDEDLEMREDVEDDSGSGSDDGVDEDELNEMFGLGGEGDDDEDDEEEDEEGVEAMEEEMEEEKGNKTRKVLTIVGKKSEGDEELDEDDTALELKALMESKYFAKKGVPDKVNEAGILQALEEVRLKVKKVGASKKDQENFEEVPWVETLSITSSKPTEIANVSEDLTRELAFYDQALRAVQQGHRKLDEIGVPHKRPDDYFAEMVKTDAHMSKVRMHMLKQKQQIEEAEARRQNRQNKLFGKQVQREKAQERAQKKKAEIEAVKKWRKNREQGMDDALPFEDKKKGGNNNAGGNKFKKQEGNNPRGNKKREFKNKKFGFGGKKKGSKENTKASTNDFKGFSLSKNKSVPRDLQSKISKKSAKGKGGKANNKRPGKRARQRK